jgi:inorganic pyrophosphatase
MPPRPPAVIPYRLHPWPGVSPGEHAPGLVTVSLEMVPGDTVKYEVDKHSGHLMLDRPQKYSSQCPAPYGFIPQTYCGSQIASYAATRAGRSDVRGDGDPLDICVLTERTINQGGILVTARPIGGFRMFDGQEADDKIVAVLRDDAAYGELRDITACARSLIDRLRHYFLTYKDMPQSSFGATSGSGDPGRVTGPIPLERQARRVEITDVYDAAEAEHIIRLALLDYQTEICGGPVAP